MRQLFLLHDELFDAISFEDMVATFNDMTKAGIAKPPYLKFTVGLRWKQWDRMTGARIRPPLKTSNPALLNEELLYFDFQFNDLENYKEKGAGTINIWDIWNKKRRDIEALFKQSQEQDFPGSDNAEKLQQGWHRKLHVLYVHLITLLATRNIRKDQVYDKLAKLGIGKAHRAEYTTTLRIGTIAGSTNLNNLGGTVRPHWRRGHIRREQHYGPKNAFIREVFIPPVFVNGDPDFVPPIDPDSINLRAAYNVSLGKLL